MFDDMVPTKELSIEMKEGESILDYEILFSSEKTNKFSIEKINDNRIIVKFDYIDKNDGVVVQILHTGTQEDIIISCKIKGGMSIRKYGGKIGIFGVKDESEMTKGQIIITKLLMIAFVLSAPLLYFVSTVLSIISCYDYTFQYNSSFDSPVETILALIFSVFMELMGIKMACDFFLLQIPKSLRPYSSENICE